MIASLGFESATGRVRRARFVPRAALAIESACAVANGVRDALRGALGDGCLVTLGDPVALDAAAWRALARHALAFALPGQATDVVFVLPRHDARALVAAAFGEDPAPHDTAWSALETGALERIIARCAPACDALCVERRGPLRAVDAERLEPCVVFFDVRVASPVRFTIGVGIARAPAEPRPSRTLSPAALGSVPLETRVILGRGTLAAAHLLQLGVGDIVRLDTKVAGEGELNLAGRVMAFGTCGVVDGRAAFDVRSTTMRGDVP